MVGVAGKSRACHDCKRRRVKCDYQKPSCLRCGKAGRPCSGYEKTSIFVNRTIAEPSLTALTVISQAKLCRIANHTEPDSRLSQNLISLRSASLNVASPVAFRSQAWEILNELYLPRPRHAGYTMDKTISCFSWLHAACQMSIESDALDQALLAFCAVQIHIAEPKTISLDSASQSYHEALGLLVQKLTYASEQRKDETLAAIVVLSTCELFIMPNDNGWRAHAQGISALLSQHRTCDERSLEWQKLCSRLRLICIIIALTKGTQLALDTDTWSRFMDIDNEPSSLDSLMDAIADVPSLLDGSHNLGCPKPADLEYIQTLLGKSHQIASWQQAYRLGSKELVSWTIPSKLHNPADDGFTNKLFPFAIEYKCLNDAMLLMFSSAVMLQLVSAAILAGEAHGKVHTDNIYLKFLDAEQRPWSLPALKAEANRLARFLCQSMEYCCRYEMGTVGAQASCHPQYALGHYFRQAGLARELDWCKNIKNMDGYGLRRGIDMMLFGGSGESG